MPAPAPETDPETGLPVGPRVDPTPAPFPQRVTLEGRYIELTPLNQAQHGAALWEHLLDPANDHLWRYLPVGPFADRVAFDAHLHRSCSTDNPLFFAILDGDTKRALGWASLMRIEPAHRCVEVGYILYTPALQRTRGATEAMYLLARYVFEDLGYRRYEWKCDALNAPSRLAALRLGFNYEGTFRQHMVIKGRSRDTAWYSILDGDWPARKARLESWLDPANFDAQGIQKQPLSAISADTADSVG
ncbi:MAG: GNAT family N-acetyltransferase [Candidatus Dormibacteria bacterium]